jgi:molybdopterin molybdotransferase
MLTLDEALSRLTAAVRPFAAAEAQSVSTFDALGRVLVEDVRSALDVPPQDNSAMDGYALRCAAVAAAGTTLEVTQRIAAGVPGAALRPGTIRVGAGKMNEK